MEGLRDRQGLGGSPVGKQREVWQEELGVLMAMGHPIDPSVGQHAPNSLVKASQTPKIQEYSILTRSEHGLLSVPTMWQHAHANFQKLYSPFMKFVEPLGDLNSAEKTAPDTCVERLLS